MTRVAPGAEPSTAPGETARSGIEAAGTPPGISALLEDWITIWQSELACLVTDRELQDAALRMIDGWAAQMRITVALLAPALSAAAHDPARPNAAAGAPPVAPAPDRRDELIQQLTARVAELERRLPP